MKRHLAKVSLALAAALCVVPAHANQELLNDTNKAKAADTQHNKAREGEFISQEQKLQSQYQALIKQRANLNKSIDFLSAKFQSNEELLAEKEKELTLATGSLGEIFGVVRQAAKDVQLEQERSVATIGLDDDVAVIDEIIEAKSIPSKDQLYGLWHSFEHQIQASSKASTVMVPYVDGSGELQKKSVLRMGSLALADDTGYLAWNSSKQIATPYTVQPKQTLTSSSDLTGDMPVVALDATRGALLEQLANNPTLMQRIEQGGVVGKIILGLLLVGLLIGVYRAFVLMSIKSKINKQLKDVNSPTDDNPLGRVMLVHKEDQSPTIEALELRLLEAVMDEQESLEQGISTIKLLAALAPMLGLLGTVTGMIDTFQTITQFGNADPRIMAGGISMALITTVLGLVAAMPLLLVHNMLSSLSEGIRNVVEKQGVGLVAESAERKQEATA